MANLGNNYWKNKLMTVSFKKIQYVDFTILSSTISQECLKRKAIDKI